MIPTKSDFWERHHRKLIVAAVPVWVVFIVTVYLKTRPQDRSQTAVNTLTVGALPVT